jgi:stearoyl-CoA desaturase (delta-9 desaturase)
VWQHYGETILESAADPSSQAKMTVSADSANALQRPAGTEPLRIEWAFALGILFYHLIAALAFLPFFFSWTGVACAVLGIYVFGVLGINLGFHRLLAHQSFCCPKWLEHTLAVLGICCVQDSPARWVAIHRRHHHHTDDQQDPHSPLVSFLWAHVGWILLKSDDLMRDELFERYAKDLMRDKFYGWIEATYAWIWIPALSWAAFFFAGFAAELLLGGTTRQALQFGGSLLIWGVFVRTVVHWHFTWSVNSVTHLWGYRNYETSDSSRNNVLIAIISNGEGWHNNHHAAPRSARHGHRWWEMDVAWLIIRFLMWVGLARPSS